MQLPSDSIHLKNRGEQIVIHYPVMDPSSGETLQISCIRIDDSIVGDWVAGCLGYHYVFSTREIYDEIIRLNDIKEILSSYSSSTIVSQQELETMQSSARELLDELNSIERVLSSLNIEPLLPEETSRAPYLIVSLGDIDAETALEVDRLASEEWHPRIARVGDSAVAVMPDRSFSLYTVTGVTDSVSGISVLLSDDDEEDGEQDSSDETLEETITEILDSLRRRGEE